MSDLFSNPIKSKKVRIGIIAYQYPNGTINIDGYTYLEYSMTSAIQAFRKKHPKK